MRFVFEDSIGYYINKAATIMRLNLYKAFQGESREITVDYWVVLNRLWQRDGMIQNELARLTGKDNASITRILDGMQKKDLVRRQPDENDRRAYKIFLTEKARGLETSLKDIAGRNAEMAMKNLSTEEITQLKRILKKIIMNY